MATKKVYIVVGDNNFWYSQVGSLKEANSIVRDIKDNGTRGYDDYELPGLGELFIFEAREVARFDIPNDDEQAA